jgi:KipI family sensor histidine kinase inhibitor
MRTLDPSHGRLTLTPELRSQTNPFVGEPQRPLPSSGCPRFLPVGDAALTVEFGSAITPEVNEAVVALDVALAAAELDGIVETVPSYRSLMICYEPSEISFSRLVAELRHMLFRHDQAQLGCSSAWTVPVVYDPPHGEDLTEVAQRLALAEEQVIAFHTGSEYQVYAVGFAPGLPYLGGLPPALHISRRKAPRPSVPAGAVIIGGIQAAILPVPMPSAWYSLGRTPLRLFDLGRRDPFLFRPGDRVRFRRIDLSEFDRLAGLTTDVLLPLVRVEA